MIGADFGRDRGDPDGQFLESDVAENFLELGEQPLAADQSGAGEAEVEITEDAAAREVPRPGFEFVEMAGRVAGGRDGADRGPGDDIGLDAVLDQRADDADMGKAAGGTARKREPDRHGLAAIDLADVGGAVVTVGHVASQNFQHGEHLLDAQDRSATDPAQEVDATLVNRLPAGRDREAGVAT